MMDTVTTIQLPNRKVQWLDVDENTQKRMVSDYLLYEGEDYIRGIEWDSLLENLFLYPLSSEQSALLGMLWEQAYRCWRMSDLDAEMVHDFCDAKELLKERRKVSDDHENWPVTPIGTRVCPFEYDRMMADESSDPERFRPINVLQVAEEYNEIVQTSKKAHLKLYELVAQAVESFQELGFSVLWSMIPASGRIWAADMYERQDGFLEPDEEVADW